MKRILFTIASLAAFTAVASAQTVVFSDDFQSNSTFGNNVTPAGWTAVSGDDGFVRQEVTNVYAGIRKDNILTPTSAIDLSAYSAEAAAGLIQIKYDYFIDGWDLTDSESAVAEYTINGTVWTAFSSIYTADVGSASAFESETITLAGNAALASADFNIRFNVTGADHFNDNFAIDNVSVTVVPEPGTYALLAGLAAFSFVALRRRNA